MKRLRAAAIALRDFARGFLGLARPIPSDAAAARREIEASAERRPHCC